MSFGFHQHYDFELVVQLQLQYCNLSWKPVLSYDPTQHSWLVDILQLPWSLLTCYGIDCNVVSEFRLIRVLDDIGPCLQFTPDGTNLVQPAMELSEMCCCDLVSSVQPVPSWLTSGNCTAPSWRLAINLSGRNQVLQSEVTMLIMIKWNQIIYIFQSHRLAGNWLNCGGCCDQTLQS